MKRLKVAFTFMVLVTIVGMITITIGSFDRFGSSFYIGAGGFCILFYSWRTLTLLNKDEFIEKNRLNIFDKFCGYIGLLNGFVLFIVGIITVIGSIWVSITEFTKPSSSEIGVAFFLALYGYTILYYIRQTLKKFR